MRFACVLGLFLLASCFEDSPPVSTGGSSGDDDTAATSATGADDDGSSEGMTSASGGMSGSTTGASTGDTTADGETGPPPGGCGDALECIVPPADWNGPVLVSLAPGDDSPPPCPPGSDAELLLQRAQPPGPPQCECSCDDPEGVICPQPSGSVGVSTTPGATCAELNSFDIAAMCSGNAAPAFTAVGLGTAVLSAGKGGSCAAAESVSIPPLVIDESIRVCGDGQLAEPCEGGGVCAPELPGVGSFRLCVVREGAHACPPDFPDAHSGFASYSDDRDCSPCGCSEPAATCTPTLGLHSADGCGSLVSALSPDECVDGAGVAVESYSFFNTVSGSCTAAGGSPQGNFQPQDITSVCCEP